MSSSCHLLLHTGQQMPILGLGTWHHGPRNEIQDAIRFAVRRGYRHIDGAHIYLNEEEVGQVYREIIGKEVDREEMFITSKLWCTHHEPHRVEEALRATLRKLGLDYLDLYYIHWPAAFEHGDGDLPKNADGRIRHINIDYVDTWRAMEGLVEKGLVRALGLCNFNTSQISRILKVAKVMPAVHQVESNPRIHNEIMRKYCEKHGIRVVGYSPFGSPDLPWGEKLPHLLAEPALAQVARKHGRSVAQVILTWQMARGVGVIPKSIIESELLDNLLVLSSPFELDESDLSVLANLDRNVRKIVPIVTLADGSGVEIRDLHSKYFPFAEEETEECLKK